MALITFYEILGCYSRKSFLVKSDTSNLGAAVEVKFLVMLWSVNHWTLPYIRVLRHHPITTYIAF